MKSERMLKFLISLLILVLALLGYVLLGSVFNFSPFNYEGPLTKSETVSVKVYWGKTGNNSDCSKVESTERQVSNSVHRAKEAFQYGVAGSCRVLAIRAQIESTLKQFPSIKKVVISVNGRTGEVLQP